MASKAISSNGNITFAELKQLLQTRFCGPDYKRALELKFRNLRFTKDSKIAPFVHDLRNMIQELYGLAIEDSVDSIAINHVMSTLDETIRKETNFLQLSGNIKLESILELISEKLEGYILGLNIAAFRGAAQSCQSNDNSGNRLTRSETMMANVLDKLDNLQTTKADPKRGRQQICEHCQKAGHDKSRCFQLK